MFDSTRLAGSGSVVPRADRLADLIAANRVARLRSECELIVLAAFWADAHDPAAVGQPLERGHRWGGDGTPMVADFADDELGALLHTSGQTAGMMMGDALDLRHRLPRTWDRVKSGSIRAFQARRVAQDTRHLTEDAARTVDEALASHWGLLPWPRLQTLLEAAVLDADPDRADERAKIAEAERFVTAGRSTDHGLKLFVARATAGDVIYLMAMINRLADILRREGDRDRIEVRRATALGILANPGRALQLLTRHAHDVDDSPPRGKSTRTAATRARSARDRARTAGDQPRTSTGNGRADLGGVTGRPAATGPASRNPAPWCPAPGNPIAEDPTRESPAGATAADAMTPGRSAGDLPVEDLGADCSAATTTSTSVATAPVEAPSGAPQGPDGSDPAGPDSPPGLSEADLVGPDGLPDPEGDDHRTVPIPTGVPDVDRQWDRLLEVAARRFAPVAVLHVHVTDQAVTGDPGHSGVARVEGIGPVTLTQVRRFLDRPDIRVRIQPVLDPAAVAPVDAYEIPHRLREAVRARHLIDTFPYSSCAARSMDLDHTTPHADGGATSTVNLSPLTRHHHRVKTHAGWGKRQPDPDTIVWRSPHGTIYLVTPDGTLDLGHTSYAGAVWRAATASTGTLGATTRRTRAPAASGGSRRVELAS